MKFATAILFLVSSVTAYCKTSAIIEDQKTVYSIPRRGSFNIFEYTRIKILDEHGYNYAVYRDYYDKFRRITSVKLSIIDAAGQRIKKLTRADARDVMFNEAYELGDNRMLVLDPKYRNFPFTIELEVEISYESYLDFPMWLPRAGSDLEVKKAQLIFEHYPGFQYRLMQANGVSEPTVHEAKHLKGLVWSVENLASMPETISSRLFYDGQPQVKITPNEFNLDNKWGSFLSWSEFGDWFLMLNNGRDNLSAETISILNSFKAKASTQHELVRMIYGYMQQKTRYISIQLGIGGYQTIPSDQVEKLGYGDCKALTNYMMAMLKQVNIKSNYVLVQAGEDARDIQFAEPSNQFNHVFLAVPMSKDTIWLECTSQQSPASYLGTFTDDRHVLWVDRQKSKIIRTPSYSAVENKKVTTGTAKVNEAGDGEINLKVVQTGAFYNNVMAYQHLSKPRQETFNYANFSYKDFTIKSFSYETPEPALPILNLNYGINVAGLAKSVGGKLLVPANVVASIEKEVDFDVQNRKTEVRRAFTLEDEIVVSVPENYWSAGVPKPFVENSPFGSLEITIHPEHSNQIRISRKVVVKKGMYRGEEFDRFYEFIRKVKTQEQSKIVLQSKT
jgi:hypothetical protein